MKKAEQSEPPVQPRGFTNDGKVTSDIVNDSYGTVDPADSTGLEDDEKKKGETSEAEREKRTRQR